MKQLNDVEFRKFGSFQNILESDGEFLGHPPNKFFRDLIQLKLGSTNILSLSSLQLCKRPMIIGAMVHHKPLL